MSVNLSIKNAPEEVVAALKLRAKQNHRSLQGELMAIIEEAARADEKGAMRVPRDVSTALKPDDGPVMRKEARQQNIERAVTLMREGLSLGGGRFTRDEMHER
ncbi:MAG TPA: Arc family DNA-binding protein [Stellaceae bacterium]|nr:Arc family DNA-binding protein [Stellaceae bacterium]